MVVKELDRCVVCTKNMLPHEVNVTFPDFSEASGDNVGLILSAHIDWFRNEYTTVGHKIDSIKGGN